MWPWGHLAVGYLAYAVGRRGPPGHAPALLVALGTQFPDLVDKPLAWYLGVLPNGRSLAHSAIVAALVLLVLRRYTSRTDLVAAFGVGYLSHLAADGLYPLLAGAFGDLAYLGWPLLPALEYTDTPSISRRLLALYGELAAGDVPATFGLEVGLFVVATGLWVAHGFPGLAPLVRRP